MTGTPWRQYMSMVDETMTAAGQATSTLESVKTCYACREALPTDRFHADRNRKDGLQGSCKSCRATYMASYWKRQGPGTQRRRYQVKQYGLTPEDYERMLVAQGGVCAICCTNPTPERRLCVDHDHETLKVRALLCIGCNSGIGQFREEPDFLIAAAEYVVKHKGLVK